ncbi:MAG: non-ribosomal peptide synthetase [Ramlibacter sp.]|nr:non-ribosomal peptide synthetase [Ramlibacter sp.]
MKLPESGMDDALDLEPVQRRVHAAARPEGLIEAIERHARARPSAAALLFPLESEQQDRQLGWRELYLSVCRHAAYLADAGARRGDRVVILSESVAQQVLGFLGAIAAGCVPTIVSHPSSKQSQQAFEAMLRPVLAHSRAKLLLYGNGAGPSVRGLGALTRLLPFAEAGQLPPPIAPLQRDPDEVLFLQFSSGTTGARKAIAVSQAMLLEQARAYADAIDLEPHDTVVSWLPLYHDMGLVAAFLIPLWRGAMGIHLSPFDWLMRPERLFELVQEHRATLMWLPNFAYELCASRLAGGTWQLASLRAIVNCSEPVRKRAHDRFLDAFAATGVRAQALQTCYAMAETTFAITQSDIHRPATLDRIAREPFLSLGRAEPADAAAPHDAILELVSCGSAVAGTQVRIAEASQDRMVGEIEVSSTSLFAGYLFNAEDTGAFTPDGWLRTGDLGYLAGDELYVTGRRKDLIIRRGHNIYPSDVEEALADVPGCKPGRVVAFGVDDEDGGTQEAVVMIERASQEVDAQALRTAVRETLLQATGETVSQVVVCDPNTLRKSTSGKLSRAANRQLYLELHAGRDPLPAQPGEAGGGAGDAGDPFEEQLALIWAQALRLSRVPREARLFAEMGADSVAAMQAVGEIARQFGKVVEPSTLLREDTVARQARWLRSHAASGTGAQEGAVVCLQQGRHGCAPLFLVHAASGRAWPYRTLLPHLDPGRPVYAFQAPELFGTARMLSVQEMASHYLDKLLEIQPRGPYLLAGWSFGGAIAHTLASNLAARGHEVSRLVLFDTDPPATRMQRLQRGLRHALARRDSLRWMLPQQGSSCARFLAVLPESPLSAARLAGLVRQAAPQRLAHLVIDGHSVEQLWELLTADFALHGRPEESKPFLLPGQDARTQLRNAQLLVKNRRLSTLHRPRQRFAGAMDIFAANDAQRLAPWTNFAGNSRLHVYPIQGTDALPPHFCMFEPDNVALFGAHLNRLLGEVPPPAPGQERNTP